jgi:ATP-dependent DNA helicase RecG
MNEQELIEVFNELISLPAENECVEFKEANRTFDFDKLGEYFSSLSNEANLMNKQCSWLVFGVVDKTRKVCDTQYRPDRKDLDSLKREIADKTTGRITFIEIYELNLPDGRVIMFQIPPAPSGIPVAWDGHYFGRDGESTVALNISEIDTIRNQSKNEDWSAHICESATIDDLDADAIAQARLIFKNKQPQLAAEVDSWDNETFLNSAKITINSKITKAAILLLGKSVSEHYISPAQGKISWILKGTDNVELDYFHFSIPFLLNVDKVFQRIRNLRYRYMKEGSLFPEETDTYDPYVIREALHNCIAHQDYTMGGKITVVEFPDKLVFSNEGRFIPKSIDDVLIRNSPDRYYRNRFLAEAMVNLKMIDTVGSGIKRMFKKQRERFFPMPEYQIDATSVSVEIIGKILDMNYAIALAKYSALSLTDIVLLDKIQKKKQPTDDEAKYLKEKKLIEGRKPNFHISIAVAEKTGQKAEYLKHRGIDDEYCRKMIRDYLKKFKKGTRKDFDKLLLSKFSDVLNDKQKQHKVKNLLQAMKTKGEIELTDEQEWQLKTK